MWLGPLPRDGLQKVSTYGRWHLWGVSINGGSTVYKDLLDKQQELITCNSSTKGCCLQVQCTALVIKFSAQTCSRRKRASCGCNSIFPFFLCPKCCQWGPYSKEKHPMCVISKNDMTSASNV